MMGSRQVKFAPEWAMIRTARVCSALKIPMDLFIGPTRHPSIVECRNICAFTLVGCQSPGGGPPCSQPDAAYAMGRVNHSGICQMNRKAAKALDTPEAERSKGEARLANQTLAVMDLLGLKRWRPVVLRVSCTEPAIITP